MSSSPTGRTSTTGSSISSPSRGDVCVIACGAIAQHCKEAAQSLDLRIDVVALPPLLHNHPEAIAGEVERLVHRLSPDYSRILVGYADCGTYGALDEVCDRLEVRRLAGLHCYDVYAGAERMRELFESQPGTYVLTDFLVRSFAHTVVAELGLDRYPELREDYFGHYSRVVWIAQHPDDELARQAASAAESLGLPLTRVNVGVAGLEAQLMALATGPVPPAAPAQWAPAPANRS